MESFDGKLISADSEQKQATWRLKERGLRGWLREWLGVAPLEYEMGRIEEPLNQCLKDGESLIELESRVRNLEKDLTSAPAKTKIIPKPVRSTWKSFRTAAERASEPQGEE